MDSRRDYELTVLWRSVVWPDPLERAADLMRLEPDPYERLLAAFLEAVGAGLETRRPSSGDLSVLLGSADPRVRLAGIRLSKR